MRALYMMIVMIDYMISIIYDVKHRIAGNGEGAPG